MAFTYEILGKLLRTPVLMVVIVNTVVMPKQIDFFFLVYLSLKIKFTKSHSSGRRFVIYPEGDPREYDDEAGGQIGLEHEVTEVALQLE